VKLELSHLVSQHFGDVRDAGDSLETALPDAPRTHPKNNNIGTISLHSVLHELEMRLAAVPASSKARAVPHWNLRRSSEGLITPVLSWEMASPNDYPYSTPV
jgi:hypothetical protein